MTVFNAPSLSAVFAALADPTRRAMMARLAQGPCSVTELGAPFAMSAPAISKHLRVLEQAVLIERWKAGRVHYCALLPERLQQAGDWIEQHRRFWEQQFAALDDYLESEASTWTEQGQGPADRPSSSTSGGASRHRRNASSRRGRSRKR